MKTMPPFAAQQSLFRAYDIRGARQYFTTEFIQALGAAFVSLYHSQPAYIKPQALTSASAPAFQHQHQHQNKHNIESKPAEQIIVMGYDVRLGSDLIAQMLAEILSAHQLTVIHLGLITTPMMAFWAQRYQGHGIMVTASHSGKDTLGIKWLVANTSPSAVQIRALYNSLLATHLASATQSRQNPSKPLNGQLNEQAKAAFLPDAPANIALSITAGRIITLPKPRVFSIYNDAIAAVFTGLYQHHSEPLTAGSANLPPPDSILDLTVVIDCMHGATSNLAGALFRRFCRQVIVLNDTPDGSFPAGNPDPTEPNRLAELQQSVIINEADIGLAFDGDGDRLMIVDNSGKVVTADHLLFLLAQVAITERPIPTTKQPSAPEVIFDIKCSHRLPQLLMALGAIPVMSKTGSSLLRRQLQAGDNKALFAGELSGHFIFNDGYFMVYDDAMYAGLRLLHWLVNTANANSIDIPLSFLDKQDEQDKQAVKPTTILPTMDLWGTIKSANSSYQLTDITQNLPVIVSTADHYLPLDTARPTDCSIVQHLIDFCHYLQRSTNDLANAILLDTELLDTESSSDSALNDLALNDLALNDLDLNDLDLNDLVSCHCCNRTLQMTRQQAQQLLSAKVQLSCIDGVRLDFAHGFGVVRQSNTSHSLTVRFAGDSLADLQQIQAYFVALCQPFDGHLALQISAINAE